MSGSTIKVTGIKAYGHIGVYDEEKRDGQPFVVDFTLYKDTLDAGDRLEATIDYSAAARIVKSYVEETKCDLIESVAYALACKLLNSYECLKGVSVTVHKPCAPLGMEFDDVSVSAELFWHDVCLGLGSNMGDRRANLDYAANYFKSSLAFKGVRVSDYLETKPYGGVEQNDFLNACVRAYTYLTPMQLLNECMLVEKERGRKRTLHWGPRTLDIDILLYDSLVISAPELTLPHSDMCNRMFVLQPLSQIAGDIIHPIAHKSINVLKSELEK
ncbi:MAG: 2-amino-4-hydroxy-6-hydroxymethyldihydropteridine diphosphokinase [Clostridia bacterium]|nr:2-amino-4-hydroxy-6-hydroxymethyldihydropteridine diphosphokinase [Clostridia bacterium]